VVAMYGRLKILAAAFAGRCEKFIGIGGVPVYAGYFPRAGLPQLPIPVTETHPVVQHAGDDPALVFSCRLADAEAAVFSSHSGATVFRFPMVYGPHNPRPHEWSIVRRVRDGRPHMILPDGGFQIHTDVRRATPPPAFWPPSTGRMRPPGRFTTAATPRTGPCDSGPRRSSNCSVPGWRSCLFPPTSPSRPPPR